MTNTINGTSGTGGFQITVSGNGQIFLGLPNSLSLTTNMTPWGCGSFFDTNATNGSWSGTVNYGDGSGNQQLFLTIPPSGSCAQSGTNTGVFAFDHAYADGGNFIVTVTVKNVVSNATNTATFTVNVTGGEQIFVNLPNSLNIQTGVSSWGCGSFSDSTGGSWTGTVNYGDNAGDQPLAVTTPASGPCGNGGSTGSFSFSHSYSSSGLRTVTVSITNTATHVTTTNSFSVNVNAPQIFVNVPNSASTQVNSTPWGCGSFNDSSATGGPWNATIDYGDGSGTQSLTLVTPPSGSCAPTSGQQPTGVFSFNHPYGTSGTRTVTVTVTNTTTNATQTSMFSVTVNGGSQQQIFLGLPNSTSTQVNNASWGCGSFFDTNATGTAYSATVNYGDGSGDQQLPLTMPASGPCASGGPQTPTGTFSFNHSYGTTGQRTVTVTVRNTLTGVAQAGSFTITVNSNGGGGSSISLGLPASLTTQVNTSNWGCGTFFDSNANGGSWTVKVDYGDNSGMQTLPVTAGSGACSQGSGSPTGSFSFNHAYSSTGQRTVSVTVTNIVTNVTQSKTFTVTVNGPTAQIFLGIPTSASANVGDTSWGCGSFLDTNATGGAWIGNVDYGDGSGQQSLPLTIPAAGPCAQGGSQSPTGTFAFAHAYASTGTFTVNLQIKNTVTNVSKSGGFNVSVSPRKPQIVSIDVNPRNAHLLVGGTLQYFATAHFDDNTSQTTDPSDPGHGPLWSSTNTAVATVDQNGLVTALAAGQTTIVAAADAVDCNASGTCATLVVDPFNTPVGDHVNVSLTDTNGTTVATVQFDSVTTTGESGVTMSSDGPSPSPHFNLGNTFYDITTTAIYTGPITTCVSYAGVTLPAPVYVRLLHYNGSAWDDVTTAINTTDQIVCGVTTSLSPFVVASAIDAIPPVIGTVSDVSAEATSSAGAIISFALPTVSDDLDPNPHVSATPGPGTTFGIGASIVTITAVDSSGNTATKTFNVVVGDHTPPTVAVVDVTEATTSNSAVVAFTATATDLVDGAMVPVCVPASGSTFAVGTTRVTCSATDAHGNTGSASFTVTVVKGKAPRIALPAQKIEEATGPTGAVVTFNASATVPGEGPVPVTCLPASGSLFPLGTTTVTCSATSSIGLTATDTIAVTVRDTKAPKLDLPPHQIAEATSPAGASVSFTATATDVVDGAVPIACTPASGSTFPLGKTVVSCTATDHAGNAKTGTFNVTVRDTTPPEIVSVIPSATTLAATDLMTPVTFNVDVQDIADPAPSCSVIRVTSNVLDVDHDGVPDWSITGALSVALEAATPAHRDRRYVITVRCTDGSGNSSRERTTIVVSHM
ncbi:MAG TPA: HYR domain-containing protein [Vicinamibacterales bacterium]|nr:HYR domain-containing protein [Vicinamibacterales bacterium]